MPAMTYDDLADFIAKKMKTQHIYQPLLIRTLLDSGGVATVRQIAQAFLGQDESQIIYYEKRIKAMPVPVLKRRGVVERDGELVTLNVHRLTLQQKAHLRLLCEQRMQEFIQARGLDTWGYRLGELDPVPDSVRYLVLRAAKNRCALCGITTKEAVLHVDHIIPRSRGGTNDLANLQALCAQCNQAKSNKDDTDFRELPLEHDPECRFCECREVWTVEENGTVWAHKDGFPVTPGHHLVVPKRHTADLFEMTERERRDADDLLRYLRGKLLAEDDSIEGFNVGMNCGAEAGQSIFHAHWHLIPRRNGDSTAKRGGVRGVIPERMDY
jgi:ATP adenylyltransferase